MNYTLRIYTNGDGDFYDTDFETLADLYNSLFETGLVTRLTHLQ